MTPTPKEKAKDLVELYCQVLAIRSYENKEKAKQCAIIACEEILKTFDCTTPQQVIYWKEVKEEIKNLK